MSFCSCDYDGEYATVESTTYPRAAKEYRCCECGAMIRRGDVYQRVNGLWDGKWSTFITCEGCANVRSVLCDCYEYTALWMDWEGEIPLHGQDKLSPAGIAKLDHILSLWLADNADTVEEAAYWRWDGM